MKKIVNVGFDLDDVLNYATLWYEIYSFKYAREHGLKKAKIFPVDSYVDDKWNWPKEHKEAFLEEYTKIIDCKRIFKPEVKGLIGLLKNHKEYDFKIFIVSSRNNKFYSSYDLVKNLLEADNILYDKIKTNVKDKGKICLENNIHYYIDDSYKHCQCVSTKGIKTFIMDCEYNFGFKDESIRRVFSLREYVNYILSDLENN